MTFNKRLITGAVGATLTVGLGLPAAQASHGILIPYVVKDANRTTIVTLSGLFDNTPPQTFHLQYWTKSTTDANTAACLPNSSELAFTDNDIVTFDTAGLLAPGPLFGDTTNAAPLGTSISFAGPRHGYLLVSNSDFNAIATAAYWVEIDLTNGGAHGGIGLGNGDAAGFDNFNQGPGIMADGLSPAPWLQGASAFHSLHVGPAVPLGPLSDGVSGFSYGNAANSPAQPVTFWPGSVASSAFTVTPLGTRMDTVENNQAVMHVRNSSNVQGAYDRNENGIDGTVPQTVRCVGRLTAAQLMPGVVSNAAWAAIGGWGWLANLGDGDTNYTEGGTQDLRAAVYQVDTSSAAGAGKFMQNATPITSLDF